MNDINPIIGRDEEPVAAAIEGTTYLNNALTSQRGKMVSAYVSFLNVPQNQLTVIARGFPRPIWAQYFQAVHVNGAAFDGFVRLTPAGEVEVLTGESVNLGSEGTLTYQAM